MTRACGGEKIPLVCPSEEAHRGGAGAGGNYDVIKGWRVMCWGHWRRKIRFGTTVSGVYTSCEDGVGLARFQVNDEILRHGPAWQILWKTVRLA